MEYGIPYDWKYVKILMEVVATSGFETKNTAWIYSTYTACVWGSGSIPSRKDGKESRETEFRIY